MRLWQDDVLVVDTRGRTLPMPFAVYNSLEVGVTANHEAAKALGGTGGPAPSPTRFSGP